MFRDNTLGSKMIQVANQEMTHELVNCEEIKVCSLETGCPYIKNKKIVTNTCYNSTIIRKHTILLHSPSRASSSHSKVI